MRIIQINYEIKRSLWLFLLMLPVVVISQQRQLRPQEYKRWGKYAHKNTTYISAYWGHGSYLMNQLNDLQSQLLSGIGIDAGINSNFPPYWLYGVAVARKYDDLRIGMNVENMSTGARSSISDYSGRFYSDIICKATKLGVFVEKDLWKVNSKKHRFVSGYRLEMGGLYANFDFHTFVSLVNTPTANIDDAITIESLSCYVEPALYASYYVSKKTYFQLSAGVMLNTPNEFDFSTQFFNSEYDVSWTGYRVRLAVVQEF